jgi:hypothetical protein
MTTFKDQLLDDLDSVFLNLDEFAVEINLNGNTITAIADDSDGSFDSSSGQSGFADPSGLGLQMTTRTLRIKQTDAEGLMPEQSVTVNDERWIVDSIKTEDGMAIVVLHQGYS